jgi:WD40 repeat protein
VSAAREVTLWEPAAASGEWHRTELPGLTDRVRDVALSPDGRTLAVAGDSGVTVWDGSRYRCRVYGHQGLVHAVTFHPDGQRLATAGADGTVRLWDLGAVPVAVRSPLAGDPVLLAVLPGRRVCVTVRPPGWSAQVWESGGEPTLVESREPITGAALAPDGSAVLTTDSRGRARRWPLGERGGDGTPLLTLTDDPTAHVRELAVSPDGRLLATAVGGGVALVEAATGRRVATFPGNEPPAALVFAPDGRTLATGGHDRVFLWGATTGAQRAALLTHSGFVNTVSFAPDGRTLATAGEGHVIQLWDQTGRSLGLLAGHRGAVLGLAFSPDGRTLASVSADGTGRLWQLATGSELLTFDVADRRVTHVAFSPDGRYLAFAGPSGPARPFPGAGFMEVHDCGWPLAAPPAP